MEPVKRIHIVHFTDPEFYVIKESSLYLTVSGGWSGNLDEARNYTNEKEAIDKAFELRDGNKILPNK